MKEKEKKVESVLDEKNVFDVKDIKRANRIKQRILFAVIILLVLAGVAAILVRTYCRVREIEVSESSLYDSAQIAELTGIKEGDNLFSFNASDTAEKIRQHYPYLKNVRVSRKFPTGVQISFTEDLGSMCIRLGEDYYAIDDEQTVLKQCDSPDDGGVHRIVIVSGRISRCVVGQKIEYTDESLFKMVDEICRAVEDNGVLDKIDTINMTDKFAITMDFDSRFLIRLGSTENLKYKIAMVVKVVEELYEDDRGEIDVTETSTAYVKLYNK